MAANRTSNQTFCISEQITTFLFYLDACQRIFSLITHLGYFLVVLKFKKLRYKSYIFINHFMFANFIYCGVYLVYIKNERPSFSYLQLNHLVCSISSILWSVFKYLRFYSILLVSIHRFIAVYYLNFFKRINRSNLLIGLSIFLVWLISAIISLLNRFVFQTTYGKNNCFDGYSTNFNQSLHYYLVSVLFGMALPTILVMTIYVLIYRKLKKMSNKLSSQRIKSSKRSKNIDENYLNTEINTSCKDNCTQIRTSSFGGGDSPKSIEINLNKSTNQVEASLSQSFVIRRGVSNRTFKTCKKTQTKFANQFLTINFCLIISFLALSLGSMRNVVTHLNEGYYFITQILRIINVLAAALIPIFSLFYPKSILKSILK